MAQVFSSSYLGSIYRTILSESPASDSYPSGGVHTMLKDLRRHQTAGVEVGGSVTTS